MCKHACEKIGYLLQKERRYLLFPSSLLMCPALQTGLFGCPSEFHRVPWGGLAVGGEVGEGSEGCYFLAKTSALFSFTVNRATNRS